MHCALLDLFEHAVKEGCQGLYGFRDRQLRGETNTVLQNKVF